MLAGCSLTRLSRFSYAVPHAVQSTDPGLSISAIRYYTLCRRFFILILFTDDRGAHIDGDVIAGNRPARARIATSWRGPRWRLPEARRPGVDIIAGARVADSALEGTGFEPSVPPRKRRPSREAPRPTIVVSRDDLCLMTPSSLSVRHLSSATAEGPFTRAGPMVRIRFPPAKSRANSGTDVEAARLSEVNSGFLLSPMIIDRRNTAGDDCHIHFRALCYSEHSRSVRQLRLVRASFSGWSRVAGR